MTFEVPLCCTTDAAANNSRRVCALSSRSWPSNLYQTPHSGPYGSVSENSAMSRTSENVVNTAAVSLAACALLLGGLQVRRFWESEEAQRPRRITEWQDVGLVGSRLGPATASVIIVEFIDYQCPFCRKAAPVLRQLQAKYAGKVSLVLRHLSGHDDSFMAAVAVECAGKLGRFEPYHDHLFSLFDSLGSKPWMEIAREVGIGDTTSFSSCLSDPIVSASIKRDMRLADSLGITATPTFLINDRLLVGFSDSSEITDLVDKAFGQPIPRR